MKKFLLSFLAMLSFSGVASAVTAEELDGKYFGGYARGIVSEATFPKEQFGGHFELRNGTLYMCDFWRAFDIPVTVNGDNITLPTSRYSSNPNSVWPNSTLSIVKNKGYTKNERYYIDYGYTATGTAVVLKAASTNVDCEYKFATDNAPIHVSIRQNGDEIIADGNGLEIYVFSTNTKVTEYKGTSVGDQYRVDIQLNENDPTKATVKNWGYWGINFENIANNTVGNTYYLGWVNAKIDYEKMTFTIPRQIIGGDIDDHTYYLGYGYLHGYNADWYRCYGGRPTPYYYYAASGTSGSGGDIVGKMKYLPYHKDGNIKLWHKDSGGDLETWHNLNIEFGPMQTWSDQTRQTLASVDKTIYETEYFDEHTHAASLTIDKVARHSVDQTTSMARFAGKIHTRTNKKYVDSYDIYVVAGNQRTVSGKTHDEETGLDGAFLVQAGLKPEKSSTVLSSTRAASADDDEDDEIPFDVVKTYEGLGNYTSNGQPSYTLFVKTNYTPESGLAPTFHALTNTLNATVTGIDDIVDENENVKAYAVAGGIEVVNFDGEVFVYNTAGANVYSGNAGNIELANGIYIVKAGSKTFKLNVK